MGGKNHSESLMIWYLIMCRSLTYAQGAVRVLERAGITATILRSPKGVSREGCSYSVKVSKRNIQRALAVLNDYKVQYGKIYETNTYGELREVFL